MRDCSRCKHCDLDYIFDPEVGDEFPFYSCDKGHDTESDFECNDFEEYKPTPYVEKYTECDMCEFLQECMSIGNIIDCTMVDDKRKHYIGGLDCRKKEPMSSGLRWLEPVR